MVLNLSTIIANLEAEYSANETQLALLAAKPSYSVSGPTGSQSFDNTKLYLALSARQKDIIEQLNSYNPFWFTSVGI